MLRRETQEEDLTLGDHRFGRINRRMPIGPVRWPHHDLLWIHEGAVRIAFPEHAAAVELVAPAGLLILPQTLFSGGTSGGFATASICHFQIAAAEQAGWLLPPPGEALHLQHMIRLAMELAQRGLEAELPRRRRLLLSILDGFSPPAADAAATVNTRLAMTWRQAAQNLHRMRTLADVAALIGLSESRFRDMHRATWHTAAGEHLRNLRLSRAEELIVGTDKTLAEIATAVGYRHAATLSAAFRARRGKSPAEFRHWSNPFA